MTIFGKLKPGDMFLLGPSTSRCGVGDAPVFIKLDHPLTEAVIDDQKIFTAVGRSGGTPIAIKYDHEVKKLV